HVAYRDVPMKCRKRARHRRGSVTLDQNQVRALVQKQRVQVAEQPSAHCAERLIGHHHRQIVVVPDPKQLLSRPCQIWMLTSEDRYYPKSMTAVQGGDDWRQFDGLRTGAEDGHYSHVFTTSGDPPKLLVAGEGAFNLQ